MPHPADAAWRRARLNGTGEGLPAGAACTPGMRRAVPEGLPGGLPLALAGVEGRGPRLAFQTEEMATKTGWRVTTSCTYAKHGGGGGIKPRAIREDVAVNYQDEGDRMAPWYCALKAATHAKTNAAARADTATYRAGHRPPSKRVRTWHRYAAVSPSTSIYLHATRARA